MSPTRSASDSPVSGHGELGSLRRRLLILGVGLVLAGAFPLPNVEADQVAWHSREAWGSDPPDWIGTFPRQDIAPRGLVELVRVYGALDCSWMWGSVLLGLVLLGLMLCRPSRRVLSSASWVVLAWCLTILLPYLFGGGTLGMALDWLGLVQWARLGAPILALWHGGAVLLGLALWEMRCHTSSTRIQLRPILLGVLQAYPFFCVVNVSRREGMAAGLLALLIGGLGIAGILAGAVPRLRGAIVWSAPLFLIIGILGYPAYSAVWEANRGAYGSTLAVALSGTKLALMNACLVYSLWNIRRLKTDRAGAPSTEPISGPA